jgi:N utilization substance protein B
LDISCELDKMENIVSQHPRRIARESVMQALYAQELNNGTPEDIIDLYVNSYKSPDDTDYMRQLFFCVIENKTWADELICKCLENWEYERVAIVDKILLRMGVSEIYHMDDIPPKVSISEMVEIAKVFSTEESSSFVNGILDTIYKNFKDKS